jgi:hypothetical protein
LAGAAGELDLVNAVGMDVEMPPLDFANGRNNSNNGTMTLMIQ